MLSKDELVDTITRSINSGLLTTQDLQYIINNNQPAAAPVQTVQTEQPSNNQPVPTPVQTEQSSSLSAVDTMFHVAGIIIFASIMAMLFQLDSPGIGLRLLLTIGVGSVLWSVASYLIKFTELNATTKGVTNAILLTGSLSVISGGLILASDLTEQAYPNLYVYTVAATLAIAGVAHLIVGKLIKHTVLSLTGILLVVSVIPILAIKLLSDASAPSYLFSIVSSISGGILIYATYVASRAGIIPKDKSKSFNSFGIFIVLLGLYIASFDESTGIIWLIVTICGIIGLFYLSIVKQDKLLLGSGSFFLVLTIITVSFRYFSGLSVAVSLLIASVGLIATAIVATTINRRYIKN